MTATCVVSAAAIAALVPSWPARDIAVGMAGPLLAACVTWWLVERTWRANPAGLSGVMMGAFAIKLVLFGVYVVFALRELDPDSVPVNFLIPFEGTPLGGQWALTPQRCLRILAMVRFTCPDAEVRLAGGREIHLRSLQPLALHIVNSIFLGDYLTSEGQAGARDLEMIADAGFTVEGAAERTLPEHRRDLVRVRRRGPGTSLPANA